MVSRFVDMAFYSSVAENNAIIQEAKYWVQDGVVVKRSDVPAYLKEVDSVLIGPGLRRDFRSRFFREQLNHLTWQELTELDWEFDTQAVTAVLLQQFLQKQWVIDAGALQVLQPAWIPPKAILTPHLQELSALVSKLGDQWAHLPDQLQEVQAALGQTVASGQASLTPKILSSRVVAQTMPTALQEALHTLAAQLRNVTFIVKGQTDLIWDGQHLVAVVGGNAGLTKGGTGDALAGLITAFVTRSAPLPSTVVASFLNKLAGHHLYEQRGVMYNTTDLVEQIPFSWQALQSAVAAQK